MHHLRLKDYSLGVDDPKVWFRTEMGKRRGLNFRYMLSVKKNQRMPISVMSSEKKPISVCRSYCDIPIDVECLSDLPEMLHKFRLGYTKYGNSEKKKTYMKLRVMIKVGNGPNEFRTLREIVNSIDYARRSDVRDRVRGW